MRLLIPVLCILLACCKSKNNDVNIIPKPQNLKLKNDFFHLYESPTAVDFDSLCVGLVPWINNTNRDECEDFLRTCSCPIIGGHFELNGYQVMRGVNFRHGMSDKLLQSVVSY